MTRVTALIKYNEYLTNLLRLFYTNIPADLNRKGGKDAEVYRLAVALQPSSKLNATL